jgi:transposase-like protein
MPWPEMSEMDARLIFIAACLRHEASLSATCDRHGISRKTGYKWLQRYREAGAAGLVSLSSARHTVAHAMDAAIAAAVLSLRDERPTWGPRKLLARLRMDRPELTWPAPSTVGDLLRRSGRSQPRLRRRLDDAKRTPLQSEPLAPNESWSADFKGWFRTGDGVRCEPFTVSDGYSRYLLACEAVPQVSWAQVQPLLIRLFEANGLPRALRTDNGNPFARRDGLGGLSRMSVWLLKLNVWPDHIQPGRPDQNGRHERMHRVLREDTAAPPAATVAAQQARMDRWREDYNGYRPHEALGQRCPATLYIPSTRDYPGTIAEWDYPADHQRRRVIGDGHIRWRDGTVYLSGALRGETVALARRDDGDWAVRFRGFDLAVLLDESNRLRRCGLDRTVVPRAA